MTASRWKTLTAILVFALVAWMYMRRLGDTPLYVTPDEAIIAVDAHALAMTGRDVHGEAFPLYFRVQMPGETRFGWFMPVIFYASALVMRVLPFSEATARVPSALVGVFSIVLTFLVARRLFSEDGLVMDGHVVHGLAILAAVLLATTPAHFILSRYALDYLYPLPFVLGWFLLLLRFLERGDVRVLVAATVCLGVGFYSYISSVLMMPIYFALTLVVVLQRDRPMFLSLAATAGFTAPLLPLVPFLLHHPGAFAQTAQRYAVYDAQRLNALQGLREFFSYPNIERLTTLYWTFFNPGFLFFSGDSQMTFSTRSVGVFLLSLAVLIPAGAYGVLRRRTTGGLLVLALFVTAPAAAVLVPESGAIIRAAAMLPFGALLATYGIICVWRSRLFARARPVLMAAGGALFAMALVYAGVTVVSSARLSKGTALLAAGAIVLLAVGRAAQRIKLGRIAVVCLLLFVLLQFGSFWRDYFGDYRLRASTWLGGNVRGALEALIAHATQDRAPGIYFARIRSTSGLLDTRNRWMDAYWRFYLIKHQREDLLSRSNDIDTNDVRGMASGSLVLANEGDQVAAGLLSSSQLKIVEAVPEVDGKPFFLILRR